MSLKNLLFVTLFICTAVAVHSQRIRKEYSFVGINASFSFFDINTDQFSTEQGTGFGAGFVTRGDWYNRFGMEYGVSFFQHNVGILGRDLTNTTNNFDERYIKFALPNVQIKLQLIYYLIRQRLSLEIAPILSVNGKLKPTSESYDNYVMDGYESVKASDIANVSTVHFLTAAGLTAGIDNFRANVQYQYGVTNFFNRFNDTQSLAEEKPNGGFKGHTSTILLGLYIFF
jgi:hypothetical protein